MALAGGDPDARVEERWRSQNGLGLVDLGFEDEGLGQVDVRVSRRYLDLNRVTWRLKEPSITSVESLADDLERASMETVGAILLTYAHWPKMLPAVLTVARSEDKAQEGCVRV